MEDIEIGTPFVKVDLSNPNKPFSFVVKFVTTPENRIEKYLLNQSGEWQFVPESAVYPDECKLMVKMYNPFGWAVVSQTIPYDFTH